MKRKRLIIFVACLVLASPIFYIYYRVHHAQQLNQYLEPFMAQQIIQIQDKWFEDHGRSKQTDYFIVRVAPFYIQIGEAVVDGSYRSYWLSHNGEQKQLSVSEYFEKSSRDPDGTLTWMYVVQPLSESTVCIGLQANKPVSWTGGMGGVAGAGEWAIDTSKAVWQLEHYDSGCPRSDTNLLGLTLFSVH